LVFEVKLSGLVVSRSPEEGGGSHNGIQDEGETLSPSLGDSLHRGVTLSVKSGRGKSRGGADRGE